jgi:F0F1-type ATP synthase membrane subunit b/b'
MSATQRVRDNVRKSIGDAEEFIKNTKKNLQEELSKTTPRIQHDLDRSLEEAGRALSNALDSVDKKTRREQMELLNGYRSFLQRQVSFVDDKIKKIGDADKSS